MGVTSYTVVIVGGYVMWGLKNQPGSSAEGLTLVPYAPASILVHGACERAHPNN